MIFELAFSPACARSSADRAIDYGSIGRGFKSLRAHHGKPRNCGAFAVCPRLSEPRRHPEPENLPPSAAAHAVQRNAPPSTTHATWSQRRNRRQPQGRRRSWGCAIGAESHALATELVSHMDDGTFTGTAPATIQPLTSWKPSWNSERMLHAPSTRRAGHPHRPRTHQQLGKRRRREVRTGHRRRQHRPRSNRAVAQVQRLVEVEQLE
jgi:hypothetical protein